MIAYSLLLLVGGGSDANPAVHFVFLGAIFAVMYLFMIRPQQKKVQQQKQFLDEMQKGDKIVTNGGIHGKVVKVEDNTVLIEIDNNTKIRVEKSFISVDFTQIAQNGNAEK